MTAPSLDGGSGGAYAPEVTPATEGMAATAAAQTSPRIRRRRPPSPQEQARRVAWGHKYGPMVGQLIRANIARTER